MFPSCANSAAPSRHSKTRPWRPTRKNEGGGARQEVLPETAQGKTSKAWLRAGAAAIAQAKSYGFRTHRDIEQYVVLAMTLGQGFEERKEFGWARDILHDRHPARAPFRATWVYERVVKQLAG